MTKNRSTLVISPGEPAGIGPDLALSLRKSDLQANLVLVADPSLLEQRAADLGIEDISINEITSIEQSLPESLNVFAVNARREVAPGKLNTENASYVLKCLEKAVSLCESGECQALVTGPVNKAVINEAGISFTGHTEWLAERTDTRQVVMMLAADDFRVALATTHLPLRDVADAINIDSLEQTIEIINRDLKSRFAISNPRILVCGLNPHAGESGHMGREEIDTIIPAIKRARATGIEVIGPLPADTAFTPQQLDGVDVVLAMFHDQGLPVLKHAGFGKAVNITLGLPIIRTSVDHGTALELAGTGRASNVSLVMAIKSAMDMAGNQFRAI